MEDLEQTSVDDMAEHCKFYHCKVECGDLLYVPPGWMLMEKTANVLAPGVQVCVAPASVRALGGLKKVVGMFAPSDRSKLPRDQQDIFQMLGASVEAMEHMTAKFPKSPLTDEALNAHVVSSQALKNEGGKELSGGNSTPPPGTLWPSDINQASL